MNLNVLDDWVPSACTLPTAERPLRVAEFDDLFLDGGLGIASSDADRVVIGLRPEAADRAAALAVKETACCSFFTFALTVAAGEVSLTISADPAHAAVLDALAGRAERLIDGARQ